MATEQIQINGSCHCGNIRFVLAWPGPATEIVIRRCGCTFCQKRDGSWTSHPGAALEATILDSSSLSKYRFGTKTAEFFVCSMCGIVPFVISEVDGRTYAVVNVKTFENVDIASLSSASTIFDGEDTESRLERRQQNWIPNVHISETSA